MINKKICMLGAFAVGKTALVQRYIHSIFSDDYLSSVGVKISKKTVTVNGEEINLMLWDLEGQDDYSAINLSYLRGAMGLFIVADGSRGSTLSVALTLRNTALKTLGDEVPHILLVNKSDIQENWEVTDKIIASLKTGGMNVIKTSAKTGENVENAFNTLAQLMSERKI